VFGDENAVDAIIIGMLPGEEFDVLEGFFEITFIIIAVDGFLSSSVPWSCGISPRVSTNAMRNPAPQDGDTKGSFGPGVHGPDVQSHAFPSGQKSILGSDAF